MNFADIILDNCNNHCDIHWWPKFAYHCTDIKNAVSILSEGTLYSRADASRLKQMHNDNASKHVIDMTQAETVANVRFYFRPKTSTQYYNEGYKHPELRYDNDENANMPVPVFFLFDIEKLLLLSETQFAEQSQSGYGSKLRKGVQAFSSLNFDKIYNNDLSRASELKKYLQAEILYPNYLSIDKCIKFILCRNEIERLSLLNMLRAVNVKECIRYQSIIRVCKEDMFENNGLFITDCCYHNDVISIVFSDYFEKKQYTDRMMIKNKVNKLRQISVRVVMDWIGANHKAMAHHEVNFEVSYTKIRQLVLREIPKIDNSRMIRIQVLVEQQLMCFVELPIENSEIIK